MLSRLRAPCVHEGRNLDLHGSTGAAIFPLHGTSRSELLRNADIALDDFGTGFASLTHLKAFRVDVLKIDRSFVRGLPNATEDGEIVNAITRLGRNLGIEVVAEGIETLAQLEQLRSVGCHVGEGFLISPAVSVADVPTR